MTAPVGSESSTMVKVAEAAVLVVTRPAAGVTVKPGVSLSSLLTATLIGLIPA